MLSSQLFWRIFGISAAFTVCTALGFVALFSVRHQANATQEIRTRLSEEGRLVRAFLAVEVSLASPVIPAEWADVLEKASRQTEARLVLISPEGKVLWPAIPNGPATVSPEKIKLLERAQSEEQVFSQQIDVSSGQSSFINLVRVGSTERPVAYLQTSLPVAVIHDPMEAMGYRLWGTVVLVSLLALLLTYYVVSPIINSLGQLTKAAQDLASGNSHAEVAVESRHEIGTLAQAFNLMSRQLASRIAELQAQQRQLQQNHQQLETVLGAMVEGVIAVDEQERIVFANSAAIRLLDLTPRGLNQRPFWEVVRLPQIQDLVRQSLTSSPRQVRCEFEVPRTQSIVGVMVSPISGEPCPGAVVVLHDVTDLRRLENLRREFVSNVSHELKTPLASISAYAETLLDGALEDEGVNRLFITRIHEQAERLNTLILELLELARLESHEETFEVQTIDATRVLQESVEEHLAVASAKNLMLQSPHDPEPLMILADAEGLQTIIDNLLDNAVNYTPAGGRVSVDWGEDEDWAWITVQDTGVGIPREFQTRIFERFFRVDKARSRELGGTGLGLSIVKHLCQVFGGHVRVQSAVGQGSTFVVRLRLAKKEVLAVSPEPSKHEDVKTP